MPKVNKIIYLLTILLTPYFSINSHADEAKTTYQNFMMLGEDSAPIKLELVLAVSCDHCSEFVTHTLPLLQKHYVDTGLVQIKIYHASIDMVTSYFSTLLFCEDHPYRFDLFSLVMKKHAEIINPQGSMADYAKRINRYFQLAGYSKDKIQACQTNFALQDTLNKQYFQMMKAHNIITYPFILIDGNQYKNDPDYENIKNKLDSLL